MTAEEIVTGFIACLDFHMASTASIHQDPYKNDFFKLVREAYKGDHFAVTDISETNSRRTARYPASSLELRKHASGKRADGKGVRPVARVALRLG